MTASGTSRPARAVVFIYDAQGDGHQPGTLPTAQGWTLNAQGGSAVGTQIISGIPSTLIVTDLDVTDRAFNYARPHGGTPTIGGVAVAFQMRSMVRIENNAVSIPFDGGNFFDIALYGQYIPDSTGRATGFGLRYEPGGVGSNQFSLGITTADSVISIPWDATSFYEVVVTKTAAVNNVSLEVYAAGTTGKTNGTLLGYSTFGYNSLNGFTGISNNLAIFGNSIGGVPTGTFDLKWATFGIGELAPELFVPIPEPSTAVLGLVGALIGYGRMLESCRKSKGTKT